jgi:hypothetical protein
MVRKLGEFPIFLLFNSGTESFENCSIFAFSLLLFVLFQNYNFASRDCNGKWMLAGRVFSTDLIILKGQGLDVILGMSWMKLHKAVLGIARRLVHLDSPVYGKVILHFPVISRIKASLHHVVELKIEDIHVVRESPDVFPDDLPRMPPERAIEFKIELQPSTAPIAKAPYKMSPMELKELKIQLQGLLDKGYIHPSTSPWGCSTLFVEKKDKELRLCVDY